MYGFFTKCFLHNLWWFFREKFPTVRTLKLHLYANQKTCYPSGKSRRFQSTKCPAKSENVGENGTSQQDVKGVKKILSKKPRIEKRRKVWEEICFRYGISICFAIIGKIDLESGCYTDSLHKWWYSMWLVKFKVPAIHRIHGFVDTKLTMFYKAKSWLSYVAKVLLL